MTDTARSTCVWATRPKAQNHQWISNLEQAGFAVADIPLLAIEPVNDADSQQAVKNLIVDFDQFNKVIFVSQNAVEQTHQWLDQYWPQLPVGIEYFAVGEKTAAAAEELLGLSAASAGLAMNSEGLLAQQALQDVWGQRILICRGKGGLPKLGEVLHERGAFVHYCELYYRSMPTEAAERFAVLAAEHEDQERIVPLFSGETLLNFDVLVKQIQPALKSSVTLIVPGKRVKEQALSLGYTAVISASNASADAMLAALNEELSKAGRG